MYLYLRNQNARFHVFNLYFSTTQWTFLFKSAAKCAVRYVKTVSHRKCTEVRIFMRPGWKKLHTSFGVSNTCLIVQNCTDSTKSATYNWKRNNTSVKNRQRNDAEEDKSYSCWKYFNIYNIVVMEGYRVQIANWVYSFVAFYGLSLSLKNNFDEKVLASLCLLRLQCASQKRCVIQAALFIMSSVWVLVCVPEVLGMWYLIISNVYSFIYIGQNLLGEIDKIFYIHTVYSSSQHL